LFRGRNVDEWRLLLFRRKARKNVAGQGVNVGLSNEFACIDQLPLAVAPVIREFNIKMQWLSQRWSCPRPRWLSRRQGKVVACVPCDVTGSKPTVRAKGAACKKCGCRRGLAGGGGGWRGVVGSEPMEAIGKGGRGGPQN
jgi:hypothetical protein